MTKTKKAVQPSEMLSVTITKVGHRKVHKGEIGDDGKQSFYSWKDVISLPSDIARALEARGFAEVDEPLE
jgi:hypothetical protein